MKKFTFILTLLILTPISLLAQGWQNVYGGIQDDIAVNILQTNDGGYILSGSTTSFTFGDRDIYIIKIDAQGNEQWNQHFGGFSQEIGGQVMPTDDGGYIVIGTTQSFGVGGSDVYVIKTDAWGNELWSQTYGDTLDEGGESILQTPDGDYVIVGHQSSSGNGGDIYLLKIDAQGNEVWTYSYDVDYIDAGNDISLIDDNGFIICGYSSEQIGNFEAIVLRLDSNGTQLWNQNYASSDFINAFRILQSNDGGFVLTGIISQDMGIFKIDLNGSEEWIQTYGLLGFDVSYGITLCSDNGFSITGYTSYQTNGSRDVYMLKTDAQGNQQWSRNFGGAAAYEGRTIQQTSDGGFVIAGHTESFGSGGRDMYLIKTDSLGSLTAMQDPDVGITKKGLLKIVDVLGRETRPKPNTPLFYIYEDGTVEKRWIMK